MADSQPLGFCPGFLEIVVEADGATFSFFQVIFMAGNSLPPIGMFPWFPYEPKLKIMRNLFQGFVAAVCFLGGEDVAVPEKEDWLITHFPQAFNR